MELLPHEKQVVEYEKTIAEFKEKNKENSLLSSSEIQKLDKRLDRLKEKFIPISPLGKEYKFVDILRDREQ